MTVLMFACKAGASGVGDPKAAARVRLSIFDDVLSTKITFESVHDGLISPGRQEIVG